LPRCATPDYLPIDRSSSPGLSPELHQKGITSMSRHGFARCVAAPAVSALLCAVVTVIAGPQEKAKNPPESKDNDARRHSGSG
jgi:hypothetical protein